MPGNFLDLVYRVLGGNEVVQTCQGNCNTRVTFFMLFYFIICSSMLTFIFLMLVILYFHFYFILIFSFMLFMFFMFFMFFVHARSIYALVGSDRAILILANLTSLLYFFLFTSFYGIFLEVNCILTHVGVNRNPHYF